MKYVAVMGLALMGACTSGDSGIGKGDCPGTPSIVSVAQVAPFWRGLTRVTVRVPGGQPSGVPIEIFDPSVGTWSGYAASTNSFLEQNDDGSYVASASINPTSGNKGGSFKIRVRAELDGCPMSAWATTDAFTVADPVEDTTWISHVAIADAYGYIQPYVTTSPGGAMTTGPYTVSAAGITHTMQFHGDGTVDEIWAFGIDSGHAGDLYGGCKLAIHLKGNWQSTFLPYYRISVSGLTTAPTPLAGSMCVNPPVAELDLALARSMTRLAPSTAYPNFDYTPLLYTPPGKPVWSESQQIQQLSQILSGLGDIVGPEQSGLTANFSFNSPTYDKQ